MYLQLIQGYCGIFIQFIGLSFMGISTLLLLLKWTGVQVRYTNNKNIKIHRKKNQHKKQWFFDVEEKIA